MTNSIDTSQGLEKGREYFLAKMGNVPVFYDGCVENLHGTTLATFLSEHIGKEGGKAIIMHQFSQSGLDVDGDTITPSRDFGSFYTWNDEKGYEQLRKRLNKLRR